MVYSVQDILIQLENYGIFEIVLPFLLIFAIVFGILSYMQIFGDNRGPHAIIAFVIGLLAVRLPFFTEFYKELFPRLGIGVTILLALLILAGLFASKNSRPGIMITLLVVAALIAIVILYQTFSFLGWTGLGYFGGDSVGWIIGAIIFVALIIAIVLSGGPGGENSGKSSDDYPIPLFYRPKDVR